MRRTVVENSGNRIPEGLGPDPGMIPTIDSALHPGSEAMNVAASFTQRVGTDRLTCGSELTLRRTFPVGEALSVRLRHSRDVTFARNGEKSL